jgi:hypothetical protein
MTVISPELLFLPDTCCLPGKEASLLNETCRMITEALRRPPLVERLINPTANVIALRRL